MGFHYDDRIKAMSVVETWSVSLNTNFVEARPLGFASACIVAGLLAMPRNDMLGAMPRNHS